MESLAAVARRCLYYLVPFSAALLALFCFMLRYFLIVEYVVWKHYIQNTYNVHPMNRNAHGHRFSPYFHDDFF